MRRRLHKGEKNICNTKQTKEYDVVISNYGLHSLRYIDDGRHTSNILKSNFNMYKWLAYLQHENKNALKWHLVGKSKLCIQFPNIMMSSDGDSKHYVCIYWNMAKPIIMNPQITNPLKYK